MFDLFLTQVAEYSEEASPVSYILMLILIFSSFPICYFIGRHKNLSFTTTFWGFLFWAGIIIAALLPANYVRCKNCGYKFNPRKTHICKVCGTSIINKKEETEEITN